jgi:hypothetical protein
MKRKNLIKSSIAVASLVVISMFGFSPAFGYGGGGGGGGFTPTTCSSVTYGDWGPNFSGFQFRDVVSQSPIGCSLSTSQQLDRSRAYVVEVINPAVETPKVTPTVEPIKQVLGEKKYADGTLIRYKGDVKIYVIVNGEKQHIRTLAELRKYAGKPILTVSDDAPEVLGEKTYADGTLLRGSDKKVYVLKNGKLTHIRSLVELSKYQGQKIHDVADSVINGYQK